MRFCLILLTLLLFSCTSKQEKRLVALQPYKGFSPEETKHLAKIITDFYQLKTVILSEKELPKRAFVTIKSPRYRADSIITIQNRMLPDSLDYIMGLTTKDISITKKGSDGEIKKPVWKYNDFGIMGLAYCPGKSAVVSSFRLKTVNKVLYYKRLEKVVIHELGHNLGLPHCPNPHCVMTSANEKIATIDKEKIKLCGICQKKLK